MRRLNGKHLRVKTRGRLRAAFEHGDLKELTGLTSVEAHTAGVLDLCVWAHSLQGDLKKALWHYRWIKENKAKLPAESWAAIHFALGVAYTRVSEYAKAREHFGRNRRYLRASAAARFFLWQGLAFYRFFTASYAHSAKYAERALEYATQSKFRFGTVLAEELLAHALLESNQVRRGLHHMRKSLNAAREIEHQSLRKSFRLNLLLNEARFGTNWDCLPELQKALEKVHPNDTYSRNALKLELANQWTLRGQIRRAYEVLDEACDSIYASQNRRQIATLNFRLAFLTWIRGGQDEALHLLKSAELQLHKEVDLALLARMNGLKERIQGKISSPRRNSISRGETPVGEDRIGDLYDLVSQKDPEGLRILLEHGLYYYLHAYYGLQPQQRALIFDLLPRGLLILDHGNVQVVERGLSRVLRRILEALAVSHQSKSELVENVWGYKYDASRHDPLVYTSVSKIRQLLGDAGNWIEADEKGYRLRSGVRLQNQQGAAVEVLDKPKINIMAMPDATGLSFRQLRILARFDNNSQGVVDVDDVMKDFEVSRATATRDLGTLTEEGFLRRLGKARATKYARTLKGVRE